MSLTGPETSDYRRSGQAASKAELPFVLVAAIGGFEPFHTYVANLMNFSIGGSCSLSDRRYTPRLQTHNQ